VAGLFLIQDSPTLKTLEKSKFSDIFYGFNISVIKENKKLYLNLCIIGIFGIATQVFMPYLIIFMKTALGFSDIEYSLIFGVAIVLGSIIALPLGKLSDKWQKEKALYLFIALFAAGLLVMYFTSNIAKPLVFVFFGLGGMIMILGNILVGALTGAMVRDNTPEANVGKLQGIRMIFSVLIPMIIGPEIGNAINKKVNVPLPDMGSADAMTTSYIPAREIFLVAAIIALASIGIIVILNKVGCSKNESTKN
jgi:MFS family permease